MHSFFEQVLYTDYQSKQEITGQKTRSENKSINFMEMCLILTKPFQETCSNSTIVTPKDLLSIQSG